MEDRLMIDPHGSRTGGQRVAARLRVRGLDTIPPMRESARARPLTVRRDAALERRGQP
jgi:hypothetical protein